MKSLLGRCDIPFPDCGVMYKVNGTPWTGKRQV
jgi:hypothetical protein